MSKILAMLFKTTCCSSHSLSRVLLSFRSLNQDSVWKASKRFSRLFRWNQSKSKERKSSAVSKCGRWRQQKSNPVSNNVSLPRALHGAWVVITFNSKNSRETCLSTKLRKHQSEVDILLKRRHAFYVNPREDLKARTLRDKDSSFIYI